MIDDEARAALAEVLRGLHRDHSGHPNSTSEADALLPVVRHLAAEELRAAAVHIQQTPVPATHVPTVWEAADRINDRADALDATPGHGKA